MANFRPSARSKLGAFALGSVLFLLAPLPARAAELYKQDLDGITVLALEGGSTGIGVGAPSPEQAIRRIREALEILRNRSPDYYRTIGLLNGQVYIKYDPADRLLASPTGPLALFRPRTGIAELDRAGARSFVAVLGARVIQWPAADIAGIIVHELVGHGRQHAQNRLQAMGARDRECEARLHQLHAYQDLGVAAAGGTMAAFRTSLEDVWCQSFSSYLSVSWPNAQGLWSVASLDAARLLVAFDTYRRYGARIQRWGEGQWTAGSFDLGPGVPGPPDDPAAAALRGAKNLIAYARLVLRDGDPAAHSGAGP